MFLDLNLDRMKEVELNLLNIFTLRINKKKLSYEGKTVGDIIRQFVNDYKEQLDDNLLDKKKKELHSDMVILINGKDIKHLKGYNTKLEEGDKLFLSYPISGG
jgi:molybdopterin converting factor small subunit